MDTPRFGIGTLYTEDSEDKPPESLCHSLFVSLKVTRDLRLISRLESRAVR